MFPSLVCERPSGGLIGKSLCTSFDWVAALSKLFLPVLDLIACKKVFWLQKAGRLFLIRPCIQCHIVPYPFHLRSSICAQIIQSNLKFWGNRWTDCRALRDEDGARKEVSQCARLVMSKHSETHLANSFLLFTIEINCV